MGPAAGLLSKATGGKATTAVATGVVHNLTPAGGFTTQVTALSYPETPANPPWEPFHSSADKPRAAGGAGPPDTASAVARKVRDLAFAALGRLRFPTVAEVRSVTAKGTGIEPPAQTLTVWEGVGGETAQACASRRLPIERERAVQRDAVATLTPFAWGRCGLALPRYPGMRVMLGFGGGNVEDPVEVGALWGPGDRMESEAGDWWLKLPVGQSTSALTDKNDHFPSGQVVNDLTDAKGNRIIEVGKLTVRVGQPPKIEARPEAADPPVSIEHVDSKASITIDQQGKITIKGKSIDMDAMGGTVTISAAVVDVKVSGQMKVGS
jgi:hypothetical protein